MSKPLEDLYFEWLYDQLREVEFTNRRRRSYWQLARLLHEKEFVWTVPNDDNREADGMELRLEFAVEVGKRRIEFERAQANLTGKASLLEVLIGLSRRLEWHASEGSAQSWAWQLIKNLELTPFYDPISNRKMAQVDEKLDVLIWRLYEHDGMGGFFPLAWPNKDQTKIEIWGQLHEYIQENQYEL